MENQQEIVDQNVENTEEAVVSSTPNDTVGELHNDQTSELTDETLEESDSEGLSDDVDHEDELMDNVLDNPNMSKGERKRIFKLIQKNQELQQKLAEAQVAKKYEFEGHNRTPAQNQFQSPINNVKADPRLDPNAPEFDFKLYTADLVKQQLIEERRAENFRRQAEPVLNDFQRVEQSLARAMISDPNFAHQMEKYGSYLTPDMKYALAEIERPELFLKHIFKNEKDVRALQNLGQKHINEQVRRFTAQALRFEKDYVSRKGVTSTPQKPKPIPQLGKRGSISSSSNGFNEQTGTWDQSVIDRMCL